MPTHSSKTQKLQKVIVSELETIGMSNELEAVANMIVRSREELRRRSEKIRLLKRSDPSMTEAMKVANIMPRGSSADLFD